MTWVQIDDGILDNPKIADVGPIGFALHVAAIVYCGRNLTDGFVPYGKARTILATSWMDSADEGGRERIWSVGRVCGSMGMDGSEVIDATITDLVSANLWEVVQGGYQIHDYTKHQRSSEQVSEQRVRRSLAGKASAESRRKRYGTAAPANATNNPNKTEHIAEHNAEQALEQKPNQSTEYRDKPPIVPQQPTLTVVASTVVATPKRARGEPDPVVLAAFTEAWNAACAPLPRLRKPPVGRDNERLVTQAWRQADGDAALLAKAIEAFAKWDFAQQKRLKYTTFCRHVDEWLGVATTPSAVSSSAWGSS